MQHRSIVRGARGAIALLLAAGLLAAGASSVSAGGRGATVVRGIQHEYGSCGPNSDGYLMTGSLEGCWWVLTFDVKPLPGTATMLASGTEHFDGCLGAICGTFETEYTYTAKFDGATEIHGRCHHWITEGTVGFRGARGEMSFTDVVDEEPFFYPYWGNIQLNRDAAATSAAATLASAARSAGPRSTVGVEPC